MSTTAIVMLAVLVVTLVGVIVYAVALHHKVKSNFGDGLPGVAVGPSFCRSAASWAWLSLPTSPTSRTAPTLHLM